MIVFNDGINLDKNDFLDLLYHLDMREFENKKMEVDNLVMVVVLEIKFKK